MLDEAQVDLAAFPTGRFGTGPDAHRTAPEGGTQVFWSSSPSEKILISPAMLMATAASGHAAQVEIFWLANYSQNGGLLAVSGATRDDSPE